MAEESQQVTPPATPDPNSNRAAAPTGPGGSYVGTAGIIFLVLYFVCAILLCLYGLIAFWPVPTPARTPPPVQRVAATELAPPTSVKAEPDTAQPINNPATEQVQRVSTGGSSAVEPSLVKLFGLRINVWDEVRLLWIVILAGALGSLVHGLRSVYWYVGNRELVWSWLGKYVMQPFAGAALAVVFYFVVRGGFFSPQAGFEQTSPFGFAALAAMVGMFSEQAVLKLREVAETILTKPVPGKDSNSKPQEGPKK